MIVHNRSLFCSIRILLLCLFELHSLLLMLLLIMALALVACSNTSSGMAQLSPTAIIVRNNSGMNFASASLSALQANNQSARAFGELAPIPNGVDQVYGRATHAPALPDRVEFRLQTNRGQIISREFQLDTLAQDAAKLSSPYVLVFELLPGGVISPLLEAP
jgi:hypothetical protein